MITHFAIQGICNVIIYNKGHILLVTTSLDEYH